MLPYTIRQATTQDATSVYQLYMAVKAAPNSIARDKQEITTEYVNSFLAKSMENGCSFVAEADGIVIGEIHTYNVGIKVFQHVFGELTIAIHPAYQGQGVGWAIFTALLMYVQEHRPDILRVELIAKGDDLKAIQFYESLGFEVEGRLRRRGYLPEGFQDVIYMGWLK